MQIRCFRSRLFDGNIQILKEEIYTVILIPLWLCPGFGGGGCTWDPGGPPTIKDPVTSSWLPMKGVKPGFIARAMCFPGDVTAALDRPFY